MYATCLNRLAFSTKIKQVKSAFLAIIEKHPFFLTKYCITKYQTNNKKRYLNPNGERQQNIFFIDFR